MFILLSHVARLESNQFSASEKVMFNYIAYVAQSKPTNKKLRRSI